MRSQASSDFWKCHQELPEHIQKLAKKNFRLWCMNPWHPSLRFKPDPVLVLAVAKDDNGEVLSSGVFIGISSRWRESDRILRASAR